MAGSKYSSELLLEGKFQFDQNSLSAAAQFTQELVKTIERPLQEMTQRIVNNLFGRQGLGQGFQSAQFSQPGFQVQSTFTGQASPGFGQVSSTFREYLGREGRALEESYGEIKQKAFGSVGTPYSPYFEAANMARMMQKAQSAGVDVYSTLSPEQRERFKQGAITTGQKISELTGIGLKEQADYAQKIKEKEGLAEKAKVFYQERLQKIESSGASSEFVAQKRTEFEEKLIAIQQESLALQKKAEDAATKTASGIQELKIAKQALEAPEREEQARKAEIRAGRIRTGLGIAGAAISAVMLANEFPYMMEEREAATAGLERGSARALQARDINRYMAMQELGGDQALMERSRRSSYIQAFGQIGLGALGMIGGGATSIFGGAGIPVALGGLGLVGSGIRDLMNTEAGATSFREREIESRLGQTREFREASNRARAQAIRAFDISTAMGDRSLEMGLYGGVSQDVTRKQLRGGIESATKEYLEAQERISELENLPKYQARQRLRPALERETAAIETFLETEKEAKGTRALTGESLFEYAGKRGIDYRELAPVIGELGQRYKTKGGYAPMQESINLAALGIGAGTQAQLLAAQGNVDPRSAFNQIKDMYIEVFASGIEKSQLPKAMERFAQIASGVGYGCQGVAAEQARRAGAIAGGLFGEGYTGEQLSFAQRMERFQFGGGRLGAGGFGNAMSMAATSAIMGKTMVGDKSLTQMLGGNAGAVAMMLAQQGQTDESIKTILTKMGMSEEDAQKALSALGGAKGFTEAKTRGAAEMQGTIPTASRGFMAAIGVGAEGGVQTATALKADEAAKFASAPKTPDQIAKEEEARKKATGEILDKETLGKKAKAQELGVEAGELSAAFSTLQKELPTFARSIQAVNDAIASAIKTMEEKKTEAPSKSFGN